MASVFWLLRVVARSGFATPRPAEVILKKGSLQQPFGLRPMAEEEKLPILKAYLERFKAEVQRYFPVPAGSPPEALRDLAQNYPAFEVIPK